MLRSVQMLCLLAKQLQQIRTEIC
uniref:Uncharacterized protein n=1 Tax=Triticum urartu TaxID=4572 RepID=A0A8R7TAX1_TRIUA